MNATQRTRILLLLMGGVLLVGASLIWVNTHRESPDDMAMQQNAQLQAVLNRRKHAHTKAMASETKWAGPGKAVKAGQQATETTVTSADLLAAPPGKTLPGRPVARLSSVNRMKDKLAKMMASGGLVPPGTAKVEPAAASANQTVPLPPPVTSKRDIAATPLAVAQAESKADAGRANPFQAVTGFQPFPRAGAAAKAAEDEDEAKSLAKRKHNLVPPPPPVSPSLANGGLPGGVSLDELPPPPSRPAIADKMKVVAVIGDHVLITFTDKKAQLDNNWPNTVTLGPGEKFESVSLVKVGDDSVTLDDDGERMVKTLDVIK